MEEKSSKNTRMTHYQGPIVIAIDNKTIQSLCTKSLETQFTLLSKFRPSKSQASFVPTPNQSPESSENRRVSEFACVRGMNLKANVQRKLA